MEQIYNFDREIPPVLNEKMLQDEIERRKLKRQTLILRVASLFVCMAMGLFAFFIAHDSMLVAGLCLAAMFFTMVGDGVISVVFYRKDRKYI